MCTRQCTLNFSVESVSKNKSQWRIKGKVRVLKHHQGQSSNNCDTRSIHTVDTKLIGMKIILFWYELPTFLQCTVLWDWPCYLTSNTGLCSPLFFNSSIHVPKFQVYTKDLYVASATKFITSWQSTSSCEVGEQKWQTTDNWKWKHEHTIWVREVYVLMVCVLVCLCVCVCVCIESSSNSCEFGHHY